MHTVTSTDGTRIAYERSGSGSPLVLVHGTTADHTRWRDLLPELERRFTVYAMDRRGRGGSGDAADYAIEREFEDVAAVVDAVGEPAFLFGHSYGATCALGAALATRNVARLALYEPDVPGAEPLCPEALVQRIAALVAQGANEEALEVFFREVVLMPEDELELFRAQPFWKARTALAPTIPRELTFDRAYRFDSARLAALSVPTLLLLGGESPAVSRQMTAALDAALPRSRVSVLAGQGHVAMATAPELLLRELFAFATE
jgi:pimeloyl-ACP methyl ester carboxylesterase